MAHRMKRGTASASAPFLRRIAILPELAQSDRFPFNIPAFAAGLDVELRTNVTFFVGENGSGKSTLLEAVAHCCGFGAHGGGREHGGRTDQEASDFAAALRLSWQPKATEGFFMRAESFLTFASYLDEVSNLRRYGGRSLTKQSHGESFLSLFVNRFDRGIFILDEPEAALSPQRQLSFLKIIHDLDLGGKAQLLVASHSPILLAYPGATLFSLDRGAIHTVAYRDTEHYKVSKEFLDSPERFFKHLFAPPEESDSSD